MGLELELNIRLVFGVRVGLIKTELVFKMLGFRVRVTVRVRSNICPVDISP